MKCLSPGILVLLLVLSACAPGTPTATPAPTLAAVATQVPTATPEPTRTSSPTPTASPVPSATPTTVPTQTPTPTATAIPPTPTDTPSPTPTLPTEDIQALVLLANPYGANYYLNKDMFEQFGWNVTLVGTKKSLQPCAQGNAPLRPQKLASEISDVSEYDVLAIMPATKRGKSPYGDLVDSQEALDLIATAADEGLPVYAPCAGVRVLAAANVLDGKQVVGESRFRDEYEAAGATYIKGEPPPVIDGNIITARRGLYYHVNNCEAIAITLESLVDVTPQAAKSATATGSNSFEQEGAAWTQTYGGPSADGGRSVLETADGGFLITGYTYSFGAGNADLYMLKTDPDGNLEWAQTFGGPGWEYGFSAVETSDGGYLATGYTSSFGQGSRDVYLVKTDAQGKELWSNSFGGPKVDVGQSVVETADGAYAVVGYTDSFGAGENDIYLLKIDAQGNELWSKTHGGEGPDRGQSIAVTSDGGFIIVGASGSFNAGNRDVYLVKTDAQGNELWSDLYGRVGALEAYDWGNAVQETLDGSFIVVGNSNNGIADGEMMQFYLVKLDVHGTLLWQGLYGNGRHYDYGQAVRETEDGGYALVGTTQTRSGKNNAYAVRVDSEGNQIWAGDFGGPGSDWGSALTLTSEGDLVLAGHTNSSGAGSYDVWLIKIAQ